MIEVKDTKGKVLLLILAACLSSIVTMMVFQYYYMTTIYEIRAIETEVYVQNTPGINVDSEALRFGIVPPGGRGRRNLSIENDGVANTVTIEAFGDIAEWLLVSENDFFLEPFESKEVEVTVEVPEDTPMRTYRSGTLRLTFRK